ncbi:putative peptidoglycan biosynthesis protein MurJ [Caloramator mitchellensis]|uniref:Probable lipid II flippase MurJ n=1 Tax=Caloramator mitchellensis TaxID=908809 RepID=A0A0R3K228_CALMK|nr:murein biosynthesis integral membrane protein MurJ [Caloramator mitchellensis]KRQ87460.1 putative peptidoglycan biosynthesis protein MurJ [Caloramator mitchellensis]
MAKSNSKNIGKATAIVMLMLFFSRILGFVREMIVAKVYGRSYVTDAFFAAFTIPDVMFYLLVGGALSSGFMPVFTQYIAKDDEDNAWRAANTFITVALIFIALFNLFGIIFAKYLVPLVAVGSLSSKEMYDLTVKLTRIMFTAVTFTVFAGLTRGILNSYNIFTSPSVGPVLYNVGMILGAVLLGNRFGIYGLAAGVILGALLNFLVQVPDFLKVGKRFRFELDIKHEGYKRMLALMGPAIIGLSISQLNLVVNQNIASVLGEGSITALRYANRLMLLPLGIFAMGIATTIFPTLNMQIARGEIENFKETFSLGIRVVLFITIPSALGMIALNVPIIRLLFKTGKFGEEDVLITAFALAFYSLAVVGQSAVQITTRGFYSLQDTKTPVKVGAFTVLVNILLNLMFVVFFKRLAIGGIALSYSITSLLNMIMLQRGLAKRLNGLREKEILISGIKATIASLLMAIAAFATSRIVEAKFGVVSKISQLIDVGAAVSVGIVVYILVAALLKMDELKFMVSMMNRKKR